MDPQAMAQMVATDDAAWDAATGSGAVYRLARAPRRCGYCGEGEREDAPMDTVAIDWRADLICARCVETHDWRQWTFDPLTNTYTHR